MTKKSINPINWENEKKLYFFENNGKFDIKYASMFLIYVPFILKLDSVFAQKQNVLISPDLSPYITIGYLIYVENNHSPHSNNFEICQSKITSK